jgi:flagellar biosynthesis/type III secretory pathway chaperone
MSRFNNRQIIDGIQNGNEEILVYLIERYFQQLRRYLRMKGVQDTLTPVFFSNALAISLMEIQQHAFPSGFEFEPFFLNHLKELIDQEKNIIKDNHLKRFDLISEEKKSVVAQCVAILDEQSKKLVQAYYAEGLSYEAIAVKFNYSNPVIAQHEVIKAMNQLEGIVMLRLYISLN